MSLVIDSLRQSDVATTQKSFIEGILHHLSALLALTIPTTSSFERVGEGCWTGYECTWAFDDKESPLRVVSNADSGSQFYAHFEYKLCDAKANLYLALVGIISGGLHGLAERMALRPSRKDTAPDSRELLPLTLSDSLTLLESDETMKSTIPAALLKAYIAVRRAEADHDGKMSLEERLQEALAV
jgi:glutamine synthetase